MRDALRESRPLVEGEDFYTEGGTIVFTRLYHLRRGYCCGNNCRHCPYPYRAEIAADKKREENALEERAFE